MGPSICHIGCARRPPAAAGPFGERRLLVLQELRKMPTKVRSDGERVNEPLAAAGRAVPSARTGYLLAPGVFWSR